MTLESVLSQTYRDFEVIIVDDGSPDDSLSIAQSYATRYPAVVHVFTHPEGGHRGISATSNLAFRNSQGEYWAGLASDDAWYPDKLERQVAFLDSHPEIGFVYGYADIIDENGAKLPGVREADISHEPDPVNRLIQGNMISGGTALVRRECFEQLGLQDESLVYGDWELWIRFLSHWKVGFMDCRLAMYRHHGSNTSVGAKMNVHIDRGLAVMDSVKRKASIIGGALARPRTRALINLQRCYLFFCKAEYSEATRSLAEAFESDSSLRGDCNYFEEWVEARGFDPHEPLGEKTRRDFAPWIIDRLFAIAGQSYTRRVATALADRRQAEKVSARSEITDPEQHTVQ